jgi:hypothetical protein
LELIPRIALRFILGYFRSLPTGGVQRLVCPYTRKTRG